MNPPESAAQGSEAGNRNMPVGVDAGRVRPPVPGPESPEHDFMPEPEPLTAEEIAAMDEAVERERAEFAEKLLAADDRLAAAYAEVQRVARELAQMTQHRDHWMNQAGANAQFAKSLQRKLDQLGKQLAAKNSEIEKLRERVAIMETAA
jgi:predicted RNase H-like nuclease (RuvC/YqgF family)